jgi:transcription initiation factor TFIIB
MNKMNNVTLPGQALASIDLKPDFIYPELARTGTALNMPLNVMKTADIIYLISIETGFARRRRTKIVTAAALYAACRGHNFPITLDEMAKVSGVDRQKIGRTYKLLSKALSLKITPASPIEYLQRLCSQLNLDKSTQLKAVEITKRASEQKLTSGNRPTAIAAAAAYIASVLCDNRKTQREIAISAGISEVTIRNNFKELNEKLGIGLVV